MAAVVPVVAGILVGAVVSKAATRVLEKIGVNEKWSGIIGAGLGMAAGYYAGSQVKGAMDAANATNTAANASAINEGIAAPNVNAPGSQLASAGEIPSDIAVKPFKDPVAFAQPNTVAAQQAAAPPPAQGLLSEANITPAALPKPGIPAPAPTDLPTVANYDLVSTAPAPQAYQPAGDYSGLGTGMGGTSITTPPAITPPAKTAWYEKIFNTPGGQAIATGATSGLAGGYMTAKATQDAREEEDRKLAEWNSNWANSTVQFPSVQYPQIAKTGMLRRT
jgi:hypothetical protein